MKYKIFKSKAEYKKCIVSFLILPFIVLAFLLVSFILWDFSHMYGTITSSVLWRAQIITSMPLLWCLGRHVIKISLGGGSIGVISIDKE